MEGDFNLASKWVYMIWIADSQTTGEYLAPRTQQKTKKTTTTETKKKNTREMNKKEKEKKSYLLHFYLLQFRPNVLEILK